MDLNWENSYEIRKAPFILPNDIINIGGFPHRQLGARFGITDQ